MAVGFGGCGCRPARPSNLPFTFTLGTAAVEPTLQRAAAVEKPALVDAIDPPPLTVNACRRREPQRG